MNLELAREETRKALADGRIEEVTLAYLCCPRCTRASPCDLCRIYLDELRKHEEQERAK